jgi:thiol-disulfide isomerase/thioredoxin
VFVKTMVLVALLLVGSALGLMIRRRNGRHRLVSGHLVLRADDLGVPTLGRRATFLQFSSEICAQCRSTARVLTELAGRWPGVLHLELDAAQRLDLARRLNVLRTPTVLLLDGDGRVVSRSSGAMNRAQAESALSAWREAAR